MSSWCYHQNFNVLGKVDGSKTVVTPDHVYFKMREATFLNDPEYSKLKTQPTIPLTTTCSSVPPPSTHHHHHHHHHDKCPSTLTKIELELLEREKERRFQTLFKELWPNIHAGRIDEATEAQKLAAEIEKNRKLNEMLLEQELAKIKAKKEVEKLKEPPLPSIYSSIYTPRCHDALNISINGLPSSSGTKVEITVPKTTAEFTYSKDLKTSHHSHAKHWSYSVSGYDLPPKSLYDTNKSLIESKEKQKEKEKLEKTGELVDSLIDSVKSLQTDLKRKSTELKLKEIEMSQKAAAEKCCSRRRLSVSFRDDYDLSPPRLTKSVSTCSLHRYDSIDSSSSESLKRPHTPPSRKARVKSILRIPRSSSSRSRSPSSDSIHKRHYHYHHRRPSSSYYIMPKVDCWNRNMVDTKIY